MCQRTLTTTLQVRLQDAPRLMKVLAGLLQVGKTTLIDDACADRSHWGRWVESSVRARPICTADEEALICYSQGRDKEVDSVVQYLGRLAPVEVNSTTSAPAPLAHTGRKAFVQHHADVNTWLIGDEELRLGEFLQQPAAHCVC